MNIAHGLVLTTISFLVSACDASATTREQRESLPTVAPAHTVSITVDGSGFRPSTVNAPAGSAARFVFTRTSDEGCGQQVIFPDQNIRRDLPLNQPVPVDITMPASGSVAFTCGMNMWRGSIVAQ